MIDPENESCETKRYRKRKVENSVINQNSGVKRLPKFFSVTKSQKNRKKKSLVSTIVHSRKHSLVFGLQRSSFYFYTRKRVNHG